MRLQSSYKKSNRLLDRLANYLYPKEFDFKEKYRRLFAGIAIVTTIPVTFVFSFVHLTGDDLFLGIFLFFITVGLTVGFFILRKIENINIVYGITLVFIGLLFLVLLKGSGTHDYKVLWLYIYIHLKFISCWVVKKGRYIHLFLFFFRFSFSSLMITSKWQINILLLLK